MEEPTLHDAADAIAATVWAIEDLIDALSLLAFTQAFDILRELRSQLGSWHPRWDEDHGIIPGRDELPEPTDLLA